MEAGTREGQAGSLSVGDLPCPWCGEALRVLKPSGGCVTAEVRGQVWHPKCADIFEALDEGIRELVLRVRQAGFETTDSGDGISKDADARVFMVPHVICRSTPAAMVEDARRLVAVMPVGWQVQASYSTEDDSAILLAFGFFP